MGLGGQRPPQVRVEERERKAARSRWSAGGRVGAAELRGKAAAGFREQPPTGRWAGLKQWVVTLEGYGLSVGFVFPPPASSPFGQPAISTPTHLLLTVEPVPSSPYHIILLEYLITSSRSLYPTT
jgi:hypothetical protein